MRALAVCCVLLGSGCGVATPADTVEPCHRYSEADQWHNKLEYVRAYDPSIMPSRDVLFIIEPALRASAADFVGRIMSDMIQAQDKSSLAGRGLVFENQQASTRAALLDVDALPALLRSFACRFSQGSACEVLDLFHADYVWAPYGYGTGEAQFTEELSCLLTQGAHCDRVRSTPSTQFGPRLLNLVWVTDQDLCAAESEACDSLRELASRPYTWQISVTIVARVPPELVHDILVSGSPGTEAYKQLAQSPRLADGALSSSCVSSSTMPIVPRNLVRNLSDDILLASACGAQPDPAIADRLGLEFGTASGNVLFCTGAVQRLVIDAEGHVPCTLLETLPGVGPITHCAQLGEHGRDASPVAIEQGLETCRIAQLPALGGAMPTAQGFFFARLTDDEAQHANVKSGCYREDARQFWFPNDFSFIPGGALHLRCTIEDGNSCL